MHEIRMIAAIGACSAFSLFTKSLTCGQDMAVNASSQTSGDISKVQKEKN